MSMNLHCKEVCDLVQTPSYITYMIYYRHKITRKGELVAEKDNWVSIRERYIDYYKYLMEGNFNKVNYMDELDADEKNRERDIIESIKRDHINYLRSFSMLNFYIM